MEPNFEELFKQLTTLLHTGTFKKYVNQDENVETISV